MATVVEQLYPWTRSFRKKKKWNIARREEKGARTYVPHKLDLDSIVRRALAISNANRDLSLLSAQRSPKANRDRVEGENR